MAQFDVFRNNNPSTRTRVPYLLDVQTNLLESLATRVVVPLCKPELLKGKLAERLNPLFAVERHKLAMLTQELAAIPVKALGEKVASLCAERQAIIAALDLLITGI